MTIAIISGSIRTDRKSHRVSLFFENYIKQNKLAETTMLDLNEYAFPIFEERLKNIQDPPKNATEFSEKVKAADAVLIVTPEYNGGYPAALKNVVDLLTSEWRRKPIAIATVSAGQFGGSQVITSLLFSLWKQGAIMSPAQFPTPNVEKSFDENGVPADREGVEKRAQKFVEELIWCAKAKQKMD